MKKFVFALLVASFGLIAVQLEARFCFKPMKPYYDREMLDYDDCIKQQELEKQHEDQKEHEDQMRKLKEQIDELRKQKEDDELDLKNQRYED